MYSARMMRGALNPLFVCSLVVGLALGQSATAPPSFEAFRLRSGTTPDEVNKAFPNYELRWLAQPNGAAMLVQRPVNPDDPDIYASLSFCNNRLWSVIRNVDRTPISSLMHRITCANTGSQL
jgi:hypothetical protein